MANPDHIQQVIYRGYGKAAKPLGLTFSQYRPKSMDAVASPENLVQRLQASFSVNFDYAQPNKYGSPLWKCLADGNQLAVGDYLIRKGDPASTFFIAGMQSMLPIMAVECNRILTFTRSSKPIQEYGLQPYNSGGEVGDREDILTEWPASVLEGPKGLATDWKLPGDTRSPWWKILIPALDGLTLAFGDRATDDIGNAYVVSSAELTDLGWRITAQQAEI